MATKKDLVEAYSFSRRRLVTAFVSGAPGGREVEPARPGRTIVGGVALAVLLAAGAAIAGVFSPTAPTDWKKPGLIISRDTGAAYVITDDSDPALHPVINSTSASLILGADSAPTLIDQDVIDDQKIGNDIGILGAPASLPTPSLLIDTGWTACTSDHAGIAVDVTATPDLTAAPGSGITVKSGSDYFLVAASDPATGGGGAYVYPLPSKGNALGQVDNLLSALNVQTTGSAIHVSRDWLNLFPTGAPLDFSTFGLTRFGQTPSDAGDDATGILRGSKVGDLLVTPKEQLLVTNDGPFALSDFAATVYRNVFDKDGRLPRPRNVSTAPQARRNPQELQGIQWPAAPLPSPPLTEPCAQLSAEHGAAPQAQLMSPADPSVPTPVAEGQRVQSVDPGRGAYVLSGSWSDTDQGSPFAIDSKGRANPLVGEDAAAQLGYGDVPVVVVPDTWVKLFGCGVNLSKDAALSPPSEQDASACT